MRHRAPGNGASDHAAILWKKTDEGERMSFCVIIRRPPAEFGVVGAFADYQDAQDWIVANAGMPEYRQAIFEVKPMIEKGSRGNIEKE